MNCGRYEVGHRSCCSYLILVLQLSNCLPGQSQLEHITSAVLGHVTSSDQPLATVVLGLKVILSICQYNAGLIHLYGYVLLVEPANILVNASQTTFLNWLRFGLLPPNPCCELPPSLHLPLFLLERGAVSERAQKLGCNHKL